MLNGQLKNLAIVFVVSDLARSHAFYAKTLGLTFEVTDFEGGYLQARLLGDVELVFLSGRATPGTTPQVVFGLAKGGIDSMVASLAMCCAAVICMARASWQCANLKRPCAPEAVSRKAQNLRRGCTRMIWPLQF